MVESKDVKKAPRHREKGEINLYVSKIPGNSLVK